MKNLRLQITDDLHNKLKSLCTHHGEMSHLCRKALREFINKELINRQRIEKDTYETPQRTNGI